MIDLVKNILVVGLLLLISSLHINAQKDSTSYYKRSLYELSQLNISSEKQSDQKQINASSTIRVISKEQIKDNSYFTLDEVLADLPGFQFRNILGLNSYSFLRGLPRQNNSILILVDNVQINELNSGGFYGGGHYNLANVERIEIMYGPASVIFGSNAISGIINIITKSPEKGNKLHVNTAVGNFNTYQTDITFSSALKNTSLQLSGMYKTTEKADLSGSNNDNYWTDELEIFETDYAIDAKMNYKNLLIGLNYQNRQSSTSTHYPSINSIHKGYGTLWNLQLINSYLKYSKKLSDKSQIKSIIYNRNASILGNSTKVVTDTGQIAQYRPNNRVGIENIIQYKPAEFFGIMGGVFSHYEILAQGYSKTYSTQHYLKPERPAAPDYSNNLVAGCFLQIDNKFFNYWHFIPGLRYEYSTSYKQVLTPRASLLYNRKKLSSKLIYAQAFRAPKPWDFTDGEGNPDLKPETFNSIEFSNTWFITENIRTELSLFNNLLKNSIIKEYFKNNENFYWGNSGQIKTKGIELSTNVNMNRLSISGYYTYTVSIDQNKNKLAEIAPHTGQLGATYAITKNNKLGLKTFYFGKRKNTKLIQATQKDYIDQAIVLNLYFSLLNYKNTNFRFIIRNLTNTTYYHTSNLTPDRFRQPQRSYMLKLSYKLNNL